MNNNRGSSCRSKPRGGGKGRIVKMDRGGSNCESVTYADEEDLEALTLFEGRSLSQN